MRWTEDFFPWAFKYNIKGGPRGSFMLALKDKNGKDFPSFFCHELLEGVVLAARHWTSHSVAEQSPFDTATEDLELSWGGWYKVCHFFLGHQYKGSSSYDWPSPVLDSKCVSPHPALVSTQKQSSKPIQNWDHILHVTDNGKPDVSSDSPCLAVGVPPQ